MKWDDAAPPHEHPRYQAFAGKKVLGPTDSVLLAMQKVVGSSPISRSIGSPLIERVFRFVRLARTIRRVF
jgi:hypothetical protein